MTDKTNEILEAAIRYVVNGWAVLPLHTIVNGGCSCGKASCPSPGKHPRIKGGPRAASLDVFEVESWWDKWPLTNVGIATGPISNDLIVLDVDPKHDGFISLDFLIDLIGAYPRTMIVETGSQGWHLYFHAPEEIIKNSIGTIADGIDVRGDGGFVVAPPSYHMSGNSYKWMPGPRQPATLKNIWLEVIKTGAVPGALAGKVQHLFKNPKQPSAQPTQIDTTDLDQVLVQSAARDIGEYINSGSRNRQLFVMGGKLRRLGLNQKELTDSLQAINLIRCKPPLHESEVRQVGKSVMRYKPGDDIDAVFDFHLDPAPKPGAPLPTELGIQDLNTMALTIYDDGDLILPGLYPGEIGQINAYPNAGKSTLMLNMALSLAGGQQFGPLVQSGDPKRVLYLDFENRPHRFVNDVLKMRQKFPPQYQDLAGSNLLVGVDIIPKTGGPFSLTNSEHLNFLASYIKAYGIQLTIVDTLSQAVQLRNENDNAEVQQKVVNPLQEIARKTKSAFMLVHHLGKGAVGPDDGSRAYRSRGASSLPGASRLVLDLEPVTISGLPYTRLTCVKIKGEPFEPVIMSLNPISRWYETTQKDPLAIDPTDPVFDYLARNPGTTEKSLIKALETAMPGHEISSRLNALLKYGRAERTAGGYALCEDGISDGTEMDDAPF